jgi:hypothetical protein
MWPHGEGPLVGEDLETFHRRGSPADGSLEGITCMGFPEGIPWSGSPVRDTLEGFPGGGPWRVNPGWYPREGGL